MLDARPVAFAARPVRRPPWVLEVAVLGALYAGYAWVRNAQGRDRDSRGAFGHGRAILHLERVLHLDPEHSIQRVLPAGGLPVHLVNGFYLTAHVLVTLAVLAFLFARRPGLYRRCRNALVLVTVTSLVIFALYPTAPPRLLPEAAVRDTLVEGGLWSLNHGGIERIADPFAAMPSLHLGWSTWVALSLAAAFPRRPRWVFALYPLVVSFVVLVTGAHWLLDLFAGSALTLVAWLLTARTGRGGRSARGRG